MGLADKTKSRTGIKNRFLEKAAKIRETISPNEIQSSHKHTPRKVGSSNFRKRAQWLRQAPSQSSSTEFILEDNTKTEPLDNKPTLQQAQPIDEPILEVPRSVSSDSLKAVIETNSLDDIIHQVGSAVEKIIDKIGSLESSGQTPAKIPAEVEFSNLDKPIQAELKQGSPLPLELSFDSKEIIPVNSPYAAHRDSLVEAEAELGSQEYRSALNKMQETAASIPSHSIRTKIEQNIRDIETFVHTNRLPESNSQGLSQSQPADQGPEGPMLPASVINTITQQISQGLTGQAANPSLPNADQGPESFTNQASTDIPAIDDNAATQTPAPLMPPIEQPAISKDMPASEPELSSTVQQISGVLELKPPEEEDSPFLTLTYDFNRIPHHYSLSKDHEILEYAYYKYKPMLVKAQKYVKRKQITKAMNYYRVIREQQIPEEFKHMIDKNINDLTDYLEKYLTTR